MGIYFPDLISLNYVATILIACLILYTLMVLKKAHINEIAIGVLGLSTVLLTGYFHSVNFSDSRNKHHLIHFNDSIQFYTASLHSVPEEKGDFWKVDAMIERGRTATEWKLITGNVQLYFPKKYFSESYRYGDVLLIKGTPQLITPPGNPGEFDYKRFLQFKNIYHQHFVKKDDVKFVAHHDGNLLLSWSYAARQWANGVLMHHIHRKQELAIASSLILGVTDALDNDLLNAYASTGTLHVLSVSGLHVSIIYLIIVTLFRPFRNHRIGKWILAFSAFLVLWIYAFITGLSPSVLRAVTMFSFVALSKLLDRRANIYNTLTLSAFCLLLYDPFMIMSVGFQLSYVAVFGIVYLQPLFYQWWSPESKILDEIWKITSVSMAAQLATFGLGLLYFNQFPNYFLLSNLFVIPGSFLVLISGLALLICNFIQPMAWCLGVFIEWVIRIMNYIVFVIEALPFSLIENVYISPIQYWLLTGALIFIVLFINLKHIKYAVSASMFLIFFSIAQWIYYQKDFRSKKIVFYKVPHHSAVDLFDRGCAYFMTDSVLYKDVDAIKFHIAPNRILNKITKIEALADKKLVRDLPTGKLVFWQGKVILQITKNNFSEGTSLNIDYLLISNNSVRDLIAIKKYITFKKLVIDSNNSFYFASSLLKQAVEQKIDVHSLLHSGALVVTI